ncbi:MAG TPA: TetR/AcrR family transcriptional regulator [Solirubrobacterales bacterium]
MLEAQSRDRTASPERARIIEALIEVAAEHGYLETTIEMIVERAGLDRPAFDRHFRGKYDCFLSAWQEMNEECMTEMLAAFDAEEDWPDRLRAVARGVVGSLCHDPERAVFGIEVLSAGDAARARRDMTMRVIASLIDSGRNEMEDPDAVPRTTAEALAGSAYGQVYAKVAQGRIDELPALVPQLMAAAVMPYLGMDVALEELARGMETSGEGGALGAGPPAFGEVLGTAGEAELIERGAEDRSREDYPPELARLPPGRHGLPAEFVIRNQRERLIAGLAEAVAEHGYAGTTIAHITRHAAVSRRTFYEHFANKDECFIAAYETVMEELRERIAAGFDGAEDWPHGVCAAIAAMLAFLVAEPSLARLAMVEALAAGPIVVERYDAAIQSFVPYFREGREGRSVEATADLSPTTEEALVGGMISLISRRVLAGRGGELEDLRPGLVEFVLTPFLGSAEATAIAR